MKVNKITTIACLLMAITSGGLLFFYSNNFTIQSLLSGIFTGFIVSFVVAVIGYFHERAKIIEAIDFNIRRLFLNITVMSKILGNVLPNIHNSTVIQDLPFKNVAGLASLNSEFLEKMNLGLYKPFYSISKKSSVCKKLIEFNIVICTIKNYSSNLEAQVLNYSILLLEIQKNQMMGMPANPMQEKSLNDLKNSINISTAKLLEYTAMQSIEISKIAQEFFGHKKKRLYWEDIRARLLVEAENIVKEC